MWAGREQTAYNSALFKETVHIPIIVAGGPVISGTVFTFKTRALSHDEMVQR